MERKAVPATAMLYTRDCLRVPNPAVLPQRLRNVLLLPSPIIINGLMAIHNAAQSAAWILWAMGGWRKVGGDSSLGFVTRLREATKALQLVLGLSAATTADPNWIYDSSRDIAQAIVKVGYRKVVG